MAWLQDWERQFLAQDRKRGAEYFRQQRVKLAGREGDTISASVRGNSGTYECSVELNPDPRNAGLDCECLRFQDGYFCKHLWATILAIDSLGLQKRAAKQVGAKVAVPAAAGSSGKPAARRKEKAPAVSPPRRSGKPTSPAGKKLSLSELVAQVVFGGGKLTLPGGEDGDYLAELIEATDDGVRLRFGEQPRSTLRESWQRKLSGLFNGQAAPREHFGLHPATKPPEDLLDVWFIVELGAAPEQERLPLCVAVRERERDGQWGPLEPLDSGSYPTVLYSHPWFDLVDLVVESNEASGYRPASRWEAPRSRSLPARLVVGRLAALGRLRYGVDIEAGLDALRPLEWSDEPCGFSFVVEQRAQRGPARLGFELMADGETVHDHDVAAIYGDGLVVFHNRLRPLAAQAPLGLLQELKHQDGVTFPLAEREAFLAELADRLGGWPIRLPDDWLAASESVRPTPVALLKREFMRGKWHITGRVQFHYGATLFDATAPATWRYEGKSKRLVRRDAAAEREHFASLAGLPVQSCHTYAGAPDFLLNQADLIPVVDGLAGHHWEVRWEGARVRSNGAWNCSVTTGIDWLDVDAGLEFDGVETPLPELLAALREQRAFVTLADGSLGQLTAGLRSRLERLARFGTVADGQLRFRPHAALILESLLENQADVTTDRNFGQLCQKLRSFDGIRPCDPPAGFEGELRPYQKDGLAWLNFLREFGLGGCLADDMGLGKTVQVLALLESRRTRAVAEKPPSAPVPPTAAKKSRRNPANDELPALAKLLATRNPLKPSLLVVPKSLVFNWLEEARRFTPGLRVFSYTGNDRRERLRDAPETDVILTTYGTLRKDVEDLGQAAFDYCILDESQAIKNPTAQAAMASRLVRADHRLAMTGTPVENHLGDLWSLFEFLNPGMLGRHDSLARMQRAIQRGEQPAANEVETLARGLRPYILRRTKQQVLTDLPEKTEQTLLCEMTPAQAKAYAEIRDHYRQSLKRQIERQGLKRSKIHVLEALLRLRQVACDPRLLKPAARPGIKIDTLVEQLEQVAAEGHKALVFSQFTSLLALVRKELDGFGLNYEYLDGQTSIRERQTRVDRFQSTPATPLFLISLKAGGQGLNLTAADYVFILDPWWNPAVEAQAIDRAHRIGQKQAVTAIRLICRGTVEEKILELQRSKSELAASIVRADDSLIRTMTADDLEMLLG